MPTNRRCKFGPNDIRFPLGQIREAIATSDKPKGEQGKRVPSAWRSCAFPGLFSFKLPVAALIDSESATVFV